MALRHCAAVEAYETESTQASEDEAGLAAASKGLRERFAEYLSESHPNPAYRKTMLGVFDQKATARERRSFVRLMGMPLEREESEISPQLRRQLKLSHEEYEAELEGLNVPPGRRAEMLKAFDELKRRRGSR